MDLVFISRDSSILCSLDVDTKVSRAMNFVVYDMMRRDCCKDVIVTRRSAYRGMFDTPILANKTSFLLAKIHLSWYNPE